MPNLMGIDISIPINTFTVAAGLAGSRKSRSPFDIVFEERGRPYLLSFCMFAGIADQDGSDSI